MIVENRWRKRVASSAGLLLVLCAVLALPAGLVSADEGDDIKELKDQISNLQDKVKDLERRVSEAPAASIAIPAAEAPSGGGGFLRSAGDISVSGYVESSYNMNFGDQCCTAAGGNNVGANTGLRVFDNDADTFSINAFELVLERLAPESGGLGFRTDIFMGEDAETLDAASVNTLAGDEISLQQAYAQLVVPWGNGIDIRAGKMVTLAGAEVIENPSNWNASRSILFGFAIPFTHTGVRAAYQLNDQWKVTTGLNNGWDNQVDTNNAKAIEAQIAWTPNDEWYATLTSITSPETAGRDARRRWLVDGVVGWNATDKLSVMANADFGRDRIITGTSGPGGTGTALSGALEDVHWHGYALYAKYAVNDKLTLVWRGEIFVDKSQFRLSGLTGPEDIYWESTWGVDYRLYKDLLTRWEIRYDKADAQVFKGTPGTDSGQTTGLASVIYQF